MRSWTIWNPTGRGFRYAMGMTLFVFYVASLVLGRELPSHNESYYVEKIAEKNDWEQEVVLWDGTRVDLVSDTRAWEVDWPVKWAEAIGQALYYVEVTVKEPGIILLVRDMDRERRYVYRCAVVCAKYDIRLLVINTGGLE